MSQVDRGFEQPTLAFEQAMSGAERVRPRTTPAGAFERAREYLRAGRRLDMVQLAADLGVSRATLYRWTGDRERLLADAVWAEAHAIAEHLLRVTEGESGLPCILAVCVDFLDYFGVLSELLASMDRRPRPSKESVMSLAEPIYLLLSGQSSPEMIAPGLSFATSHECGKADTGSDRRRHDVRQPEGSRAEAPRARRHRRVGDHSFG